MHSLLAFAILPARTLGRFPLIARSTQYAVRAPVFGAFLVACLSSLDDSSKTWCEKWDTGRPGASSTVRRTVRIVRVFNCWLVNYCDVISLQPLHFVLLHCAMLCPLLAPIAFVCLALLSFAADAK